MADIVVIGGANIDIKAKSRDVIRLGTSNPGVVNTSAGGVGRNIAHNLARLGAGVKLVSVVGRDSHGDAVLAETRHAGVDVGDVQRVDVSTGSYVAVLDHDGELMTALNDMRAVEMVTPDIIAENAEDLRAAKFVVADCNLPVATLLAIAALCHEKLVIEPVSVPKSEKLMAVLAQFPVYLASPNFDQIEFLTQSRDIDAAFEFLHGKGLRNVVIHAGPEGAFVSDGENIDHVVAAPGGPIRDVTGAGDAAVAGLVYGLLCGDNLAQAAAQGQTCAGKVVASLKSTLE